MVVVVAMILEDKDMNSLKVNMDPMEANKVSLRKAPDNVGIVNVVITSLKSAEKNLIHLSGHNYLVLVLLPCVVLLRVFHLLLLALHGCTFVGV